MPLMIKLNRNIMKIDFMSWQRSFHNSNYIPEGENSTIEGVKVNSTVRVKSTGKKWKTKRNFTPRLKWNLTFHFKEPTIFILTFARLVDMVYSW